MPVRKFRSVVDMETPVWRLSGDPVLFRTMAALWDLGCRTSSRRYPPGVHKHESIDEMQRVVEAWTAASDVAFRTSNK